MAKMWILNRRKNTTNLCPCVMDSRLFWTCSGLRKTAQARTEWLYWERRERGWQRVGQIVEVLACQTEKFGLVLGASLCFGRQGYSGWNHVCSLYASIYVCCSHARYQMQETQLSLYFR